MIDMNVTTPWIWYGRRFVLDKGYQLQITETMGTIVVLCLPGRALSPILNSEEKYLFQIQIFHLNFVQ